jgi:hypothetical protein
MPPRYHLKLPSFLELIVSDFLVHEGRHTRLPASRPHIFQRLLTSTLTLKSAPPLNSQSDQRYRFYTTTHPSRTHSTSTSSASVFSRNVLKILAKLDTTTKHTNASQRIGKKDYPFCINSVPNVYSRVPKSYCSLLTSSSTRQHITPSITNKNSKIHRFWKSKPGRCLVLRLGLTSARGQTPHISSLT